ncbi:MAG: 50S ribosomal protein L15 [Bacteroidota bacterium]
MKLHSLKPAKGSVKNRKRIARGQGSGMGGTSTRGHKGAKSRSGYSKKEGFEGGQMPLQRRVPKFGFKNPNRVAFKAINVESLQEIADKNNISTFVISDYYKYGLASKKDKVKVLNRGNLSSSLEVEAHAFSNTAKEKIESAGGKVTII